MMHFPGGSNTRENLLPYKHNRKRRTERRLPRGLEDGSQRWNWICTLGHLYEVLFFRSTNSTKFCSFALQTLRGSVRLFYKLNVCSVRLIFIWTLLWPVRST